MNTDVIFRILITGIGATICMDIWTLIQRRLLSIPSLDYALIGRWFLWMRKQRFFHQTIANTPAICGERPLGWVIHYLTGVLFALIPLILSSQSWFYQPTLATGLFAGLISLFVPFLIMQPAFGFGLAASKTPVPMKSRTMSLLTHTSYGLGLYLTAKIINLVIS
ncbi:hypothetical protein CE143_17755 [Photorhabdus luminescens]|uniref:DUF2938 domain-containing protein n=1 Tax=Photorhabdus akhurstii TaxID=171438 RepID=A0ABX8LWR6_9GAMM|nr:DUF2938 domain-containing protein [Photorhabdus akhurstii]QXF34801.1 hypothetical protein B0X70_17745 [Photorhabdus akhurstii]UJD76628.1 hypothetical protein CE143_17755 [Photorhabdus luminescens]